MSTCPVVLQVFFGRHEAVPNRPRALCREDSPHLFGLDLWCAVDLAPFTQVPGDHHGALAFRWSVDMIVCGDERWVVFGPYPNKAAAKHAFSQIELPDEALKGYRLINEHCFKCLVPSGWPAMWTDG